MPDFREQYEKAQQLGKLASEAPAGGTRVASEDMAKLYAAQFGDAPAAPPPDLP